MILFGGKSQRIGDFYLEKQEEYSQSILLKNEKEYLGIYVSNHPLNAKRKLIEIMDYTKITELEDWRNRNKIGRFNKIRLIGIIKNVNKIVTKMSGEPMAKFELEDFTGSIEIICFPKDFIKFGYKIYEEEIVIIEGHVNQEGNKYHLVLNNINSVDELEENKGLKLYILIDDESQEQVSALKNLIMKNKGDNNIYFAMNTKGKQELVRLNKKYNVNLTKIFLRELIKIVGLKKIRLR